MANWIIDRTINLDEYKTRLVLNELLVEPRKTDNELEIILHQKGVLKNEGDGALRRRWYTYLRNYGLLVSDNVTEMGRLYASSQLSLQELSLLQLIKKQIKIVNNSTIFPLKVLVGVLSNLASKNVEEAYITREEFTNYIVNIPSDSMNDINNLTNSILTSRNKGLNLTNIDGQHDDIWFNSLSQTKLFDYYGRSLYVSNFRVLATINNYYNNHMTLPIDFGLFNFGLIDNIVLPSKINLPFDLTYAKNDKNAGGVLFDFFFSDIGLRKIEEKYYGNKEQYRGVETLLSKLKIDVSNKGVYIDYKNYPNIVVLKLIGSGDSELMEVAKIMQNITIDETNDIQEEIPYYDNCNRLIGGTNVILYGAPGTGKTYSTAVYALAILENSTIASVETKYPTRLDLMTEYKKQVSLGKIRFTTFHQNYSYEDFIQGLRPDLTTPMKFNYVDGVFKSIANEAEKDSFNNYVLIIDEINRANISKVFGELITLIEPDKRKGEINEIEVTLPSGETFSVPNNLYIIGTMNSADKSISLIDAALRRRFKFIEVAPNSDLVVDDDAKRVLENVNKELYKRLKSTDLLVGHSYFIGKTIDDLENIMNGQIIPLLYEYFFDNKEKVKEVLNASLDTTKFNIIESEVKRLKIKKI